MVVVLGLLVVVVDSECFLLVDIAVVSLGSLKEEDLECSLLLFVAGSVVDSASDVVEDLGREVDSLFSVVVVVETFLVVVLVGSSSLEGVVDDAFFSVVVVVTD